MEQMVAMQIEAPGGPLGLIARPVPQPGPGQLLLRVDACGVCRTDLHILDGEIAARYPIIPGHEIVGRVLDVGAGASGFQPGQRVGVPWLGHSCGECPFCRTQRENLCDFPEFTGCTRDGGYATHVVVEAAYCFPLPEDQPAVELAPLLCAGLIGWRALRLAGDARRIGIYGFGAAGHLLAQIALWQGREVFAFTRAGDVEGQGFARALGCQWAGASSDPAPAVLDAALIFAPVGALVPLALKAVAKGGRVVCAGIHMSDIPSFAYADLWNERQILSVANLTREDGTTFFDAVARSGVKAKVESFSLRDANLALESLRAGRVTGAAVLVPEQAS